MSDDEVGGREFGRLEATVSSLADTVKDYIRMNEERHKEHMVTHEEEKASNRDSHERLHRRLTDEVGPLKDAKVFSKGWIAGAIFICGALVWALDKGLDKVCALLGGKP